ncbi:MAG: alpha/beta fold hydrolase [Hyphomicrobiales bacterium]
MRRFLLILIAFLCLVVAVFALGPREPYSGQVSFDAAQLGDDLEGYLARIEAPYSDIRKGLQKQIIWADLHQKQKTDFAVVYVHGFSASANEVRPLPDEVANHLGANLYYTRLKGHGRTSEAMADARADDWLHDVLEAVAIGEKLGDKVIVMSTSLGSSLVSLLAANRPKWAEKIAGHIMVSPNFQISDPGAVRLSWPWARYFVPMIMGGERGAKTLNPKIDHGWTLPHSTMSLMPMAKITKEVGKADFANVKAPAFFIYSPNDEVVSPQAIEKAILAWGGPSDSVKLMTSGHDSNHVIVGDILSPNTTKEVIMATKRWINVHF